jgi:hypothetical protein
MKTKLEIQTLRRQGFQTHNAIIDPKLDLRVKGRNYVIDDIDIGLIRTGIFCVDDVWLFF